MTGCTHGRNLLSGLLGSCLIWELQVWCGDHAIDCSMGIGLFMRYFTLSKSLLTNTPFTASYALLGGQSQGKCTTNWLRAWVTSKLKITIRAFLRWRKKISQRTFGIRSFGDDQVHGFSRRVPGSSNRGIVLHHVTKRYLGEITE